MISMSRGEWMLFSRERANPLLGTVQYEVVSQRPVAQMTIEVDIE
jgi:hypothetical protein